MDGLVQEKRNSNALAMELCLSYTNLSIWASWHLKSPATQLFVQQHIQTKNKENIITAPLGGNLLVTGRSPLKKPLTQKTFPCHNVIMTFSMFVLPINFKLTTLVQIGSI